ncbi:MAG: putative membrane protein [Desulforhopalus sp.]|jgi:uncharacterized membrane protein
MIRIIVAFLASVLTGMQTYLIYTEGKAFCFNSGCEIVESLTTVPPLYFNLAGFLFFQLIFWCLLWGKNGSEYWNKFARLMLMAGLVAEAVLVFFQHSIAQAFCSYCLIVCSCIVLLNVLCGLRQIFRGFVLFVAVLVACFSLQFSSGGGGSKSLEAGSIASVAGVPGRPELYLLFSSTCPHCEAVIEALDGENICGIHFNPIEILDGFTFSEAERNSEYDPSVNLGFLKNLSLQEVPVLVAVVQGTTQVISGENRILEYLGEQCRPDVKIDYSSGYTTSSTINYTEPSNYLKLEEDGCSVEEDCVKPGTTSPQKN